jgi:hypothetical protein
MLKLILVSILLISTFCPAQKVEPSGKPEVPAAIAAALQDRGLRVLDKDGTPLVSVWPAKSVATSKKEVDGANYPALEISAFLGVVAFEQDGKDLRGQTIPKGTYTMRYALLPSDGNHMGVAPNRDFLLLLSLVSDTDPSATFNEKQLYRASGKVAGAGHPAVLSLVAAEGKSGSVSTSPEGYWILHFSVKTPDSELPIALIVKGVAQQ